MGQCCGWPFNTEWQFKSSAILICISTKTVQWSSELSILQQNCLQHDAVIISAIKLRTAAWQVVNVWEFGKGRDKRLLILKQPLFGHSEPVTCLAASSGYNIIVSGSRDRTCIMWDLSRLAFIRQLRGHAAPVAAVCINELTVSDTVISPPPPP